MNKLIVHSEKEMRFLFNDNNLNRAYPGDIIMIANDIELKSDLIVDVPVRFCFINNAKTIKCNGTISYRANLRFNDLGGEISFEKWEGYWQC